MRLLALLWFWLYPDLVGPVAVSAAYTLHSYKPAVQKCCESCRGGKIIHGDGHVTDCPCPPDCKCKLRGEPIPCKDGKCVLKK